MKACWPISKAIVLEISNAQSTPVISGHTTVKLAGNGIRSLEADGGSTDDSDKTFSLHHFAPTGVLSNLNVAGFSDLIRPESLIVEDERALIFLQDFEEEQGQDVLIRLER